MSAPSKRASSTAPMSTSSSSGSSRIDRAKPSAEKKVEFKAAPPPRKQETKRELPAPTARAPAKAGGGMGASSSSSSSPARPADTVYMYTSGNRGAFQIDRAKAGTTKTVEFPAVGKLNYGQPKSRYGPQPLRKPEAVKGAFLESVTQGLRAAGVDGLSSFVYHGHGTQGAMTPGAMDVKGKDGKKTTQLLRVSGREFATSVAASFGAEADKDKARHFQFDSCWLGDTRGKNNSFVTDFTSHMQRSGFTNFTVEGSRTQLNTTGMPAYAANKGRHGVKGDDLADVKQGKRTPRADLSSGIPSLPSHVVPHPGGGEMDLLVQQRVPPKAELDRFDTPAGHAAATKLQAIFRGRQVRSG